MSNIAVLLSFSCTVTVLGADDLRLFLIIGKDAGSGDSCPVVRTSYKEEFRILVEHGSGNCIGARSGRLTSSRYEHDERQ